MSDSKPMRTPASDLTGPMGPFPLIDSHVGAADTMRQHGAQTTREVALKIARSQLGKSEQRGPDGKGGFKGLNTGEICDWSREGMYSKDGQAWCSFFACQAVRRALLLLPADVRAPLLIEWGKIATGDCDALLQRLDALGLVTVHELGAPLPEGSYFLLLQHLGESGAPIVHSDGRPNIQHVAIIERHGSMLAHTIEGNSGDMVREKQHLLVDRRIYASAVLPW